jgi:excisionase family DNA binding protein
MQFDANELYQVREVARALKVSVATIYRAVESGALDALRVGTGKGAVRLPGEAVLDYMAACRRAAATSPHRSRLVLEGLACVICGADFRAPDSKSYAVGRADNGAQVFACQAHQDRQSVASVDGAA